MSDGFAGNETMPLSMRDGVRSLERAAAKQMFHLAMWLDDIRSAGMYRKWGYATFEEFVSKGVSTLRPRAVMQLIATVRRLRAWGLLTEDRMADLEAVGLAKLWTIVTTAGSPGEAVSLIEKAKGMGVDEFESEAGSVRLRNREGLVRFTATLTPWQFETVRLALREVGEAAGTKSHARQLELLSREAITRSMGAREAEEVRDDMDQDRSMNEGPVWSGI